MKAKQAKRGKVRRGREADTTTSMDVLRCMFLLCDGLLTFDFRSSHVFARSLAICRSDFGSYPAASLSCLCRPFGLLVGWNARKSILPTWAYLFTFVTYLLVFALTMTWKFYVFWQFKILKDVKPSYVWASIDSTSIHFAVFILRSWVASLVATCRIRWVHAWTEFWHFLRMICFNKCKICSKWKQQLEFTNEGQCNQANANDILIWWLQLHAVATFLQGPWITQFHEALWARVFQRFWRGFRLCALKSSWSHCGSLNTANMAGPDLQGGDSSLPHHGAAGHVSHANCGCRLVFF